MLGRRLRLEVTLATRQGQAHVVMLAEAVPEATGESVETDFVNRGIHRQRTRHACDQSRRPHRDEEAARDEAGLGAPVDGPGGQAFVRLDGPPPSLGS